MSAQLSVVADTSDMRTGLLGEGNNGDLLIHHSAPAPRDSRSTRLTSIRTSGGLVKS